MSFKAQEARNSVQVKYIADWETEMKYTTDCKPKAGRKNNK